MGEHMKKAPSDKYPSLIMLVLLESLPNMPPLMKYITPQYIASLMPSSSELSTQKGQYQKSLRSCSDLQLLRRN